ncbi:MAG: hypothetical protein AB1801_15970 [Chloroflexota bacterium]
MAISGAGVHVSVGVEEGGNGVGLEVGVGVGVRVGDGIAGAVALRAGVTGSAESVVGVSKTEMV